MTTHIEGTLLVRNERQLLEEGRSHELAGRSSEAMECYAAVIDLTENAGDQRARVEALRRISVLHHLRAEPEIAGELCRMSLDLAAEAGADDLVAEAGNALAGFALERGDLTGAEERYRQALELVGANGTLIGKIEQNLGIIANIRGDWQEALRHYTCALHAYTADGDRRGCAMAHHNLGMAHADRQQWGEAYSHYQISQQLAEEAGDRHLVGVALMNRAEVRLARGEYDAARSGAEEALQIFNDVEARRDKAGAHRLLGMICRQRSQMALAESHLRSALEIATSARCPLTEADAAKELATLYQAQGRQDTALELLRRARELYDQLQARPDLSQVEEQLLAISGGSDA